MNIDELLSLLADKNIILWVENNKLKYKAPKEIFTDELKFIVQEHKKALISKLTSKEKSCEQWPLSLNQQSLWFVNYLHPSTAAYNVAVSFLFKTPVSEEIIQTAFNGLLEKYIMLRTSFELSPGSVEPVQKVSPFFESPINMVDSSHWSHEQFESRIYEDYKKPFDLSKAPLIRLFVYPLSENSQACLFVLHHIICDAFSLNMMLKDFFMFCHKIKNHRTILEAEKTEKVKYYEFLENQQAYLQNQGQSEAAFLFWKKQLDAPPGKLQLPYDKRYPQNIAYNGSSKDFILKDQAFDRIKEFSREQRLSVNSILMALFEITLFCLTGQSEFFLGVLSSGRVNRKLTEIFGYLINPLVKRASLNSRISFLDYLRQSHKKTLEIYNYQDLPFPFIVEKFGHKRDQSIAPLFQVLYNFINYKSFEILGRLLSPQQEKAIHRIEDFEIEALPINQQEGQFELTFEVVESADQLFCKLKYHTDLFQGDTALKIVELYNSILDKVMTVPTIKISALFDDFKWSSNFPQEAGKKEILLASNFTIDHVKDYFDFWLDYLNLDYRITIAPYDQVFQMFLNPSSEFHQQNIFSSFVFIALEKWGREIVPSFNDYNQMYIVEATDQLISAVTKSQLIDPKKINIIFTDYHPVIKESDNYSKFFMSIEEKIKKELSVVSGVEVYCSRELSRLYPVPHYYQILTDKMANLPYHEEYSMALSTFAIRKLFNSLLKPYKVIISDCDNTLWKGVAAEDGWEKLCITDEFKKYQQFLLDKKESGWLLCLASKNNQQDVKSVFYNHKEMKLKWDDFINTKINWNSKADNIRDIAAELNLGLDSFVFVDDNIVECAEVRAKCPSVLVLEFSEKNVEQILNHTWPLDDYKISSEASNRNQFYESEIERKKLLSNSYSFRQFLEDLNLGVQIEPLAQGNITRASELSYRVNQFNFTGKKLDETTIKELLNSMNHYVLSIHAKDRFSDYGMVGLVVLQKEKSYVQITHFLLSCRALGKGIEHQIMAFLGKLLKKDFIDICKILYYPLERNKPVENFLTANFKAMLISQNPVPWVYDVDCNFLSKMKFNPDENTLESTEKTTFVEEKSNGNLELINRIQSELNTISKIAIHIKQWLKEKNSKLPDLSAQPVENKMIETDLQSQIKNVWIQILNHDNFTINDNFFDIGGKSVLIPGLILELKKQCNIDLLLIDLFKYPTINALSSYLSTDIPVNKTSKQSPNTNKNKILSLKNKIKNARQRNRKE